MNNNRDKKILIKFGKHLRTLRNEKGLSQEQLNFEAGLSKNMVGLIERGEVNVTLTTIEALSKGLDIPKKKIIDFDN
ncbi:MAG: helix-turn-helix domain-containing protein [Bacteroidia bacterium]